MQIKNGKDFWAGLMFTVFGLGFMIVAINNYNMGTAVRMGPAYFPTMLGGLCALLGAFVLFRAFVSKFQAAIAFMPFRWLPFVVGIGLGLLAYAIKGPAGGGFWYQIVLACCLIALTGAFGPPHLYVILSAVVVFAFVLKPLGLYLSTIILIIISRAQGEDFKWSDVPRSIVFALVALAIHLGVYKALAAAIGLGWGMTITTLASLFATIMIGKRMKGVELGALAAVLGIFAISAFVFGLGLPFNVCPDVMDDVCRKIGLGK
ncbi:MAG: tripartite tricarboxylate transporter TctB family protein [Betaproteobacteria bacterium]|nr:tripartite tricarboxylate transporter TctB family protein [Betaproteobacteria bacterium]